MAGRPAREQSQSPSWSVGLRKRLIGMQTPFRNPDKHPLRQSLHHLEMPALVSMHSGIYVLIY